MLPLTFLYCNIFDISYTCVVLKPVTLERNFSIPDANHVSLDGIPMCSLETGVHSVLCTKTQLILAVLKKRNAVRIILQCPERLFDFEIMPRSMTAVANLEFLVVGSLTVEGDINPIFLPELKQKHEIENKSVHGVLNPPMG